MSIYKVASNAHETKREALIGEAGGKPGTEQLHTYSLPITDVSLWFDVRFELILFRPGVDPTILHDLL